MALIGDRMKLHRLFLLLFSANTVLPLILFPSETRSIDMGLTETA